MNVNFMTRVSANTCSMEIGDLRLIKNVFVRDRFLVNDLDPETVT